MPLTDIRLAGALQAALDMERESRAALATDDQAERDNALVVVRHVTALRRALESWIGIRAIRAQRAAARVGTSAPRGL